jgi:large-conductance mechanosensitive channel
MGATFSEFMFVHNIPSTAAAFSIGGASAEMAKIMARDMILPIVYACVGALYPIANAPKFQTREFLGSVVTWVCVLVTSYVLMEMVFARGVLGASTVVMNAEQKKKLYQAREKAAEPMKEAKRAVQDLVGGLTGAPSSTDYASVPSESESVLAVDHRRLSPGGPVTLKPAPADFNGNATD